MTQCFVVMHGHERHAEAEVWDYAPIAVFATLEEAEAFQRQQVAAPRHTYYVEGPLPFGLAAFTGAA